jgi:hypothetical protein
VDSRFRSSDQVARNVAAVQRGWDAASARTITPDRVRRGELECVFEVLDRGIVWDVTNLGVPGIGTYYGHRGVRVFWIDWFEIVGDAQTNILELRGAGDKVFSLCRQTGSGVASGATVTWEFAMVFTLRDEMVVRVDMYADADEGLHAAGLEPAEVPLPEPL